MNDPASNGLNWFKSSYSGVEQDCVEIAPKDDAVHVRDSKDKTGPTLTIQQSSWSTFATSVAALDV